MKEHVSILAERGQITIPKAIRDQLGLKPGATLSFKLDRGRIMISKTVSTDPIEQVRGCLPSQGRTDDLIRELRGHNK